MSKPNPNTIELNPTNIDIIISVHYFFNDIEKVNLWLTMHNCNFGCKPITMMRTGRSKKLLKFIETALAANAEIS